MLADPPGEVDVQGKTVIVEGLGRQAQDLAVNHQWIVALRKLMEPGRGIWAALGGFAGVFRPLD